MKGSNMEDIKDEPVEEAEMTEDEKAEFEATLNAQKTMMYDAAVLKIVDWFSNKRKEKATEKPKEKVEPEIKFTYVELVKNLCKEFNIDKDSPQFNAVLENCKELLTDKKAIKDTIIEDNKKMDLSWLTFLLPLLLVFLLLFTDKGYKND